MLTKKTKRNQVLMEARQVLLGHVRSSENGHLIADMDMRIQTWGAADGSHKIREWGVKTRHYLYNASDVNNTKVVYEAGKLMNSVGHGVDFQTKKDSVASLVKLYIFYPTVLLFFENEDNELQLSIYTARTFSSGLAVRFARKRFEKEMRDYLELESRRSYKEQAEPEKEEETDENGIERKKGKKKKGLLKRDKQIYEPYDFGADAGEEESDEPELAEDEEEVWDGSNWVIRKKKEYDDDED